MWADAADESLGECCVDGGADEEWFDPDVDESGDGTWRVVGVES